ncbi:FAD-dependent oxidoreductase [Zhouia sp. PK063]|uniref:FAD-dependent oxidoreductase n=1 Tax=Zhouia sp. PK063 TaxID=3373602 RepID=UPI00379B08ED
MQESKKIAVVGSGLVGTLLAVYLRKRGHEVDVFDRRSDIRNVEFSGRSINLAMSTRGWHALEKVGLKDDVMKIALPMDKRAIHLKGEEELQFQPYGKQGEAIYSISRGNLNRKMIDLAEKEGTHFYFDTKVWDVDLPNATLYIGVGENEERKALKYDIIFGADGAFSRVRHKMQRRSRFNYSQEFLELGYKELTIPANADGTHKLENKSLHIWPRGEFMLIALPNTDGSFTCTLFMPFEGENSFEQLSTKEGVHDFFEDNFPSVLDDIPNLVNDFFKNPTSALLTIKCFPWTYWDKAALIGDAAHAIVPFYGQGMNVGFEDITVLDELMDQYENDWSAIFKAYENSRKPNTDAIAELSFRNAQEMSSKTADAKFLLRKQIEKWFSAKHPDKWLPLYSRVTFSRRPYKEALEIGDAQREIMDKVMLLPNIEHDWKSEKVEHFILEKLNVLAQILE